MPILRLFVGTTHTFFVENTPRDLFKQTATRQAQRIRRPVLSRPASEAVCSLSTSPNDATLRNLKRKLQYEAITYKSIQNSLIYMPAGILVAGWAPEPTRAARHVRSAVLDRASRDARVMRKGKAGLGWSGSFGCPTSMF